jgi:subtilisin family serine protease
MSGPDRPSKVDVGITLGQPGRFDDESPEQWKEWLKDALPDERVDRGIEFLAARGFEVLGRSLYTLSLRGPPELFEQVFGSKVDCKRLPPRADGSQAFECRLVGGLRGVPEALRELVARVTIQPEHKLMGTVSAQPPDVPGNVHYLTLDDVARLLDVEAARDAGFDGTGVRLTMIDTGFDASHPYFSSRGFRMNVLLAGGASGVKSDANGHGTGCAANVFAIAPGVEFTGIKVGTLGSNDGGAPLLAGFQRALGFDPERPGRRQGTRPLPHVISVSLSCGEAPGTVPPWQILPERLGQLEACVQEALANDIVVVVAAGNRGERGFPAQMPPVIAAGGVFSNRQGVLLASNFASAFTSRVYAGRKVPDVCGLCGEGEHADYIMLPVPSGSTHDKLFAVFDGTSNVDGWARFSGTSAAAPQIAAVCALMLQKSPGLTPPQVKRRLRESAIDVKLGQASDIADVAGLAAEAGLDRATGAGLVNAKAAVDAA